MAGKRIRRHREHRRVRRELLDSRGRLRGLLELNGTEKVLTFYDEGGVAGESIRGVVAVSEALFRMLAEPDYHPEIAGERSPRAPADVSVPPPVIVPLPPERGGAGILLANLDPPERA